MVTQTRIGEDDVFLYGAYLEDASGAVLLRASVLAADAETWRPRFEALARSIRPR
jgi:hypothetical protein